MIDEIADKGALERRFRPEGKMKDSVVALSVLPSKLRSYCLRLSDGILILGNGGVKKSRTYEEDDSLRGYILNLQRFEELLKEGQRDGTVVKQRKLLKPTILLNYERSQGDISKNGVIYSKRYPS